MALPEMEWISIDDVEVKGYDLENIVDACQENGTLVSDGDVVTN